MAIKLIKNRFFAIGPYIKGKSVLDIGCVDARPDGQRKYKSTGMHLFLMERAAHLMGVDIDERGIEQMAGEGYNVVAGDAENMLLGREFDCIVAGELIEHLSNPGLFLDNMHHHLSEQGALILTTSNAFGISNFFRISKRNEIKVHAEHTCWFDPKTISQLLLRHSFVVDRIFFTNKSKWYRKRYFYKLKYQIPKFLAAIRPYFSGVLIVIARKRKSAS